MDVQGHRGCRGLLPENTLAAFKRAIDLKVNTLELDVVVSKDRKVVVSHEPYMNPLICLHPDGSDITGPRELYNLYTMDYDSIKTYDCGVKVHPYFPEQVQQRSYKPLLSEVFDLVRSKGSNVRLNIEIKSKAEGYGIYTPFPAEYVTIVMQVIREEKMLSRVNMQSFDLNILEEIRAQYPEVPLALLVDEQERIEEKLKALSFQPEILSPYFGLLDHDEVATYQRKGYKVIPWTVNTMEDLKKVYKWNVDGIITDYPNRLIRLINN
jgi:glycerophosphoryl diester phosphodiesterase